MDRLWRLNGECRARKPRIHMFGIVKNRSPWIKEVLKRIMVDSNGGNERRKITVFIIKRASSNKIKSRSNV